MDKIEIGCWLDDYGNYLGALLVIAPMVWDVLGLGFRGFWEWNIGVVGIISQLLGVGVVLLTRHARTKW